MSASKRHARKARNAQRNSKFDALLLEEHIKAVHEGPTKRKKWTLHDLATIKPKTETQRQMFEAYLATDANVVASGFPGTGKTFLAMWLGFSSILTPGSGQDRIIIVRSAVPARDIGFLPGDQKEKMAPFEQTYKDIASELIGRESSYEDMVEAGKITFMPTSFLRGLTWDNAIVIVDEIQNLSWQEIHTVMTRIGRHSRLIVCGDISQNDLADKRNEESGFDKFMKVAERMDSFEMVSFTKHDVVRSGFVKDWILAKEDLAL